MCSCVMSHLWHKWLKILFVQILLVIPKISTNKMTLFMSPFDKIIEIICFYPSIVEYQVCLSYSMFSRTTIATNSNLLSCQTVNVVRTKQDEDS